MLYIKIASADVENRPDREDVKSIDNWEGIAAGRTYKELLSNLLENANDEEFTIIKSWLMLTGEAEGDEQAPKKNLEPEQFDCVSACPKCKAYCGNIDWGISDSDSEMVRQLGVCNVCGCEFTETSEIQYLYTEID